MSGERHVELHYDDDREDKVEDHHYQEVDSEAGWEGFRIKQILEMVKLVTTK